MGESRNILPFEEYFQNKLSLFRADSSFIPQVFASKTTARFTQSISMLRLAYERKTIDYYNETTRLTILQPILIEHLHESEH